MQQQGICIIIYILFSNKRNIFNKDFLTDMKSGKEFETIKDIELLYIY